MNTLVDPFVLNRAASPEELASVAEDAAQLGQSAIDSMTSSPCAWVNPLFKSESNGVEVPVPGVSLMTRGAFWEKCLKEAAESHDPELRERACAYASFLGRGLTELEVIWRPETTIYSSQVGSGLLTIVDPGLTIFNLSYASNRASLPVGSPAPKSTDQVHYTASRLSAWCYAHPLQQDARLEGTPASASDCMTAHWVLQQLRQVLSIKN